MEEWAYWNREKGTWEKMGCVEAKESGEWEEVRGVGVNKNGKREEWDMEKRRRGSFVKMKKAEIFCFEDFGFFLLRKVKKRIRAVYSQQRHRARTILPL